MPLPGCYHSVTSPGLHKHLVCCFAVAIQKKQRWQFLNCADLTCPHFYVGSLYFHCSLIFSLSSRFFIPLYSSKGPKHNSSETASAVNTRHWKIASVDDWDQVSSQIYTRNVNASINGRVQCCSSEKAIFHRESTSQSHTRQHLCCANARGSFSHIFLIIFFSTVGLLNWFFIWSTIRFLCFAHTLLFSSISPRHPIITLPLVLPMKPCPMQLCGVRLLLNTLQLLRMAFCAFHLREHPCSSTVKRHQLKISVF